MSASEHAFVQAILGDKSIAGLADRALPNAKDEDWRFSDTRALYERRFDVQAPAPSNAVPATLSDAGQSHLVTDNGFVVASVASGFELTTLDKLPDVEAAAVKDVLGSIAKWDDAFALISAELQRDVLCLVVPPKAVVEAPIHLSHWATGSNTTALRTVIIAGRESQFTVVEDYRGQGEYLRLATTEVVVGPNANVKHVRVQEESTGAAHLLRSAVRLSAHSHYDSYTVSCGAQWARHDLLASHEGEGAFCRIDGLVLASGHQVSDTHSAIDNTRPHCESHQLHKSIVGGKAHSIFNGKILVQKGAQKIDAYQLNRSLLLSNTARVDTKPQLEILADDVRCSHGATIGQLDDEQLFYLRSRGFDENGARGMLTYAFAGEILEQIPVAELRNRLEAVAHAHTH
ncbi:MAG: Fe-S cluster assembly protein SufD [bacterium]